MPRILSFREVIRNDIDYAYHSSTTFIDTTYRKSNKFISDGFKQLKNNWKMRKQNRAEKEIHQKTKAFESEKYAENLRKTMPSYEGYDPYTNLGAGERIPHDALVFVQKSIIEFYRKEFGKSLDDLKIAKVLDFKLDNVYLYHYLVGYMRFLNGKFVKSIESYKRAIELMDNVALDDSELIGSVEKAIVEIEYKMKHTYDKIMDYFSKEKSTKKESIVSREELHYCIGVSYFSVSFYREAINHISEAIYSMELLERNQDLVTLLHLAYYYRGYSNFGSHSFTTAIEDFTKSLEFNNQDERAKLMLNNSMQRMGEEPNQICLAPPTAFHYRLLNEEIMGHIFSYLRIHSLRTLSMTCKYWKILSMKSLLDRDMCILQYEEFVKDPDNTLKSANESSLSEKLFMPKKYQCEIYTLIYYVLESPFFKHYKKKQRDLHVMFPNFICAVGGANSSVSYFFGNCKKLYLSCITFTSISYYYNSFTEKKYPVEELFIIK